MTTTTISPMRILGQPERLATVGNTSLDRVRAQLPTYQEPWECGLVRRPVAAAVLPVDYEAGEYLLVRQPRIGALGAPTLEAAAGVLDCPGDDPRETAARELAEEMGLTAKVWTTVAAGAYVSPGYSDERMWAFLTSGLRTTPARPVDGYITTVHLPLSGLAGHIARYRQSPEADLKTLTLLYALQLTL
ncbi:hypothetical protein GCM10027280_45170 [Micromonospora polyrhachis]|uniref:8-oxo-dGTP pyrophosphatase MutT (NUDIX family) n=1 Tax=Micromonospora polyrhachis TaxID=1282883 RepID=A0A7W7WPQ9_9ACTN|nr:NUDIX hydrolase [Micromonospora polyrhachis]MBB4958969.1 8-oxo-dGTP pyrophosphatase MutT (NUDIX family) [Micromonospora polyrhachis]